jgi:hypothetical protein
MWTFKQSREAAMAARTPEVGNNILARSHPSHAVPSSPMTSRARNEESEPVSPELVLVSSPELAQAVREQLSTPPPDVAKPEPDDLDQGEGAEDATLAPILDEPDIEPLERGQARHADLAQAAGDQRSTEAPAVAKSEAYELDRKDGAGDSTLARTVDELDIKTLERLQARHAELAQAVREQLSRPVPAVAKPDPEEHSPPAYDVSAPTTRPMPPPYPRPDIAEPAREPEPRRRRSRKVAFLVVVATLAVFGGGAAFAWDHFVSTPKGTQAPALPGSEAQVTPGAPTGSKPQGAVDTGAFVPGRTWVWSTSEGARAYLVRFFLNGRQVLKSRTAKNQLTLPHSFRYAAGRYRWSVRPIKGAPTRPSYGHPIVDSKFVLTLAAAARANRSTP